MVDFGSGYAQVIKAMVDFGSGYAQVIKAVVDFWSGYMYVQVIIRLYLTLGLGMHR